jgi:very-short-patch-repair endonuclease
MAFRKGHVAWWILAGKPNPGRGRRKGEGKGIPNPKMIGNKHGHALKGRPKSEEWKRKASLSKMGDRNPMRNPIHAAKMAASKRGKPNPKLKEFWRLHKDEQILKMMRGVASNRPNRKEQHLISIMEANRLPFRYVGNWQFTLGGRCPDFLNCNGKKQLIEYFGDYWHTTLAKETDEERVAFFRRFGFETLILRESDLKDEPHLIAKIKEFEAAGGRLWELQHTV